MSTINLLYKKEYSINDHIKITIPTVGQIIDNEDDYYNLVYLLTASPIDLMAQLDDIGVDFTSIKSDFDLFLLIFNDIKTQDTSLIFGDLDLSEFKMAEKVDDKSIVLLDKKRDIKIDRFTHGQIAAVLRKIHNLEKDRRRPANKEAKDFMLERARAKLKRQKRRRQESQLESLIIAMVNTEQYKYGFEGTRELSIYQFNESVRQVIKKVDYNNKMYGVYSGTIDIKGLDQSELNWISRT